MGRLDGKVSIITGAARGGGEMIARHFAKEGAKVVVADILDDRGKWVKELGEQGLYVHLDITKEDDWKRAIELITRKFGLPTVLVNNAAIYFRAPFAETPPAEFDRLYHVNVTGSFIGIRSMIEPMKAAGGGSIVQISSPAGYEGAAHCVAYSASKFALRGLVRVAAIELGMLGIRVNCILGGGGGEMTNPFHGGLTPAEKAKLSRARFGAPRLKPRPGTYTTANLAAFLASDESYQCHGQDFLVSGGRFAGTPPASPELLASLGLSHD